MVSLKKESIGLVVTCCVAVAFGLAFNAFNAPAPYLLGSLFGVWLSGALIRPLGRIMAVPRWVHVPIILGLGVLIGGMFSPEVLESALSWMPTVLAMLVITVIATITGFLFLTRLRGYDKTLALLCCLPGGQAEIILLSRNWVEKDYVVALCHLVRVTMVLCLTPLILLLVEGEAAVALSNEMLLNMPGVLSLSVSTLIQFVGTAAAGYGIARFIRLPIPHLLGPMLLSIGLHVSGIIDVPRISEFIVAVQLVIGGAIGARLARVQARELTVYILDAIANALILISIFVVAVYLLSRVMPFEFLNLLLAFIPGGIYEVTLLSLLFGFDVAYVAFHHAIRVLLVFFALPLFITPKITKSG